MGKKNNNSRKLLYNWMAFDCFNWIFLYLFYWWILQNWWPICEPNSI